MGDPVTSQHAEWWTAYFAEFRPAFAKIHPQTTAAEVRYVIRTLKLKPGDHFLDCPCGIGRVAIPLAKRGIQVTGIDITKAYLDELDEKARLQELPIRTHRTDMRRIRFENRFDAAGNIWTSLGYFEDESDNLLVVRRLFRALRPGGRVLIHLINRDWVVYHYTPSEWYDFGGVRVLEQRVFDFATSTMRSVWQFETSGRVARCPVQLRLYAYHEIAQMLTTAGFVDIHGDGSPRGGPITRDARMMFISGRKPPQGPAKRRAVP